MKAFFKLLFPLLASSIFIGCDSNVIGVQKAPSFEDREVVQALTDEPGRIEYYCDEDTAFVYLSTDNEGLPGLYWVPADKSASILGAIFQEPHLQLYYPYCLSDLYLSDPNIPVSIDASVVKKHRLDNFPYDMQPIVLRDLKSVSCKLDSTVFQSDTFTLQGSWTIYSVNIEDSVWYPPCEFKEMSIWFTDNPFEYEGMDSLGYQKISFYGFYGCEYGYRIIEENRIELQGGYCLLWWANSTIAVADFFDVVNSVLLEDNGINYQITNNWLTISDNQGNRIELFRTE